ncbi:MAG TPA: phage holin family protein [Candidatus Tectomicrobia bacterium]|nr:phage holin family protein [Candidatus Tectomicrobia bacterium]
MATVQPLPPRETTVLDEALFARLARLVRLELELGLAETRALLRTLAIAVAVAVVAAIALIAGLVLLIAAAFAPLFDAPWQHLVISGGGIVVVCIGALAWCVWRVRNLTWPKQTLTSFEENWRWLAAQLRSRLTLH